MEKKIAVVMRDVLGQLGSVVDRYDGAFNENDTENYKIGLFEFVDKELEEELSKVGSNALSELHNEAPSYLIGEESYIDVLHLLKLFLTPPIVRNLSKLSSEILSCYLPSRLSIFKFTVAFDMYPVKLYSVKFQGSIRSYCSYLRMN